ncbi:pyridoxine 5'-phosphate synthase [Ameyamaea chiangmaiensis NBRC 103196]|uniref:Pyridoxine 5'-phosphate synthase n=1 Tax=Ameyamaea chiangmaiensis TaxID=442969 RepID=A0A850P9F4_9PROT|nr:pyridoxine 5'-phosphate synthase [Ameyamaea chiangmaiensis]MBS4073804.1 pyridoxine 5'-phosphate synthase [Ameyamaea chiangmaiensis]NVN39200.1 pyridoxine 5'-phosphate synthase [Ameyamaea chiangmaiensis]GBQ68372.1 pyridoxine 5'-phosphate synthase [Ameyamaea chiangmaiensis NBRC 103196]
MNLPSHTPLPRLGVNIDHVATVRNARGGEHPDPVEAALLAVRSGADGVTLHLREDRRHIRDADVQRMVTALTAPINLEMAATQEMVAIALRHTPHACCIVPERRAEVTTEGGLDVLGLSATLPQQVRTLADAGIRVSLFIDPEPAQIIASAEAGAAVVELHTGAYAEGRDGELARLAEGAVLAASLGLEVHAGHGLTFDNVRPIAALADVAELNIGHFLIGQAIFDGLPAVITRMKAEIAAARV